MKKFYYLLLLSVIALFSACDENDWNSEDLMKTEGTLLLSYFSAIGVFRLRGAYRAEEIRLLPTAAL